MPVSPTYPGVYVEEVAGGARTITGVGTSVAAFLGRSARGPVNEPVRVYNYGDFERTFGERSYDDSPLSLAVFDYFINGGSQAVVVRLYHVDFDETGYAAEKTRAEAESRAAAAAVVTAIKAATKANKLSAARAVADAYSADHEEFAADLVAAAVDLALTVAEIHAAVDAAAADVLNDAGVIDAIDRLLAGTAGAKPRTASINAGGLVLEAVDPGSWGNGLRVQIQAGTAKGRFHLSVREGAGPAETFLDCRLADPFGAPALELKQRLAHESKLIRYSGLIQGDLDQTENRPVLSPDAETYYTVDAQNHSSDGEALDSRDVIGSAAAKTGLYALDKVDIFNLLCIPAFDFQDIGQAGVYARLLDAAAAYCEKRFALFIADPDPAWETKTAVEAGVNALNRNKNAALFFPAIERELPDPADPAATLTRTFPPCGAVAGVIARTDSDRGIWKAPAGIDAVLKNAPALSVSLTDDENGDLYPLGVNCLRARPPAGKIIWGARTLDGPGDYEYLPVRRTALYIEESLYRGTQWAVFEGNDEGLWSQLRMNIGSFMQNLFRQGAFQGTTPRDAYFVKCDGETTGQEDVDRGIVNILVGFAPLKPAEFVVLKIRQMAGQ